MGGQAEALRHPGHIVPVAHPGDALLRKSPEQGAVRIENRLGLAVFPCSGVLGGGDKSSQGLGQDLAAVADAQDRHPQGEHPRVRLGRIRQIDAVGPAGEDDADGIEAADLLQGHVVGVQLTIDLLLPDAPGDQLVILSTEIKDQNSLHCLLPQKRKFRKRV